jgi:hypothetical protein
MFTSFQHVSCTIPIVSYTYLAWHEQTNKSHIMSTPVRFVAMFLGIYLLFQDLVYADGVIAPCFCFFIGLR